MEEIRYKVDGKEYIASFYVKVIYGQEDEPEVLEFSVCDDTYDNVITDDAITDIGWWLACDAALDIAYSNNARWA